MTDDPVWLHYVSPITCGWLAEVGAWLKERKDGGSGGHRPVWNVPGDPFEKARAELILRVADEILFSSISEAYNSSDFSLAESQFKAARFSDTQATAFARTIERDLRQRSERRWKAVPECGRFVSPLFLLPERGDALLGRLEIVIWPDETPDKKPTVLPAPAMAFVPTDFLWDQALQHAAQHAGLKGHALQWQVTVPDRRHFHLVGNSGGAAARLALQQILQPDTSLPLAGVCLMSAIGADGTLGTVDSAGLEAKLRGAIAKSLPPFHTIVLSEAQRTLNSLPLDVDGRLAGARVIYAETFDQALAKLRTHLDEDWGEIPDANYRRERHRHDTLVRRPHLDAGLMVQWETCRASTLRSGGWGVVADPFFGKSAFASGWFGDDPVTERFIVAGHFFRENDLKLHSGTAAIRSIALQLCRLHGLSKPRFDRLIPSESDLIPDRSGEADAGDRGESITELTRLLNEAGQKALASDRWQLIVLDGLDEMNPRDRALVERAFPDPLPPGCFLLTTARPGGQLYKFDHLPGYRSIQLDPAGRTTTEEIRGVLDLLNAGFPERLESEWLDRLADACEGLLGIAFLLTVRNDRFAEDVATWRADPASLPRGLEAAVMREWRRLLRRADESQGSPHPFSRHSVRALLGCLALTGELTTEELKCLIRHIDPDAWRDPFEPGDLSLRSLDPVLSAARIFFDPAPPDVPADRVRRRFWHTAFPQFILGQIPLARLNGDEDARFLDGDELRSLHRALASAALKLWSGKEPAMAYAVRQACTHLRGAGMGKAWAELLLENPEFLFRRVETGSASDLFDDFPDEWEAKELGVPNEIARALGAIRGVLGRRGHFIDQAREEMRMQAEHVKHAPPTPG